MTVPIYIGCFMGGVPDGIERLAAYCRYRDSNRDPARVFRTNRQEGIFFFPIFRRLLVYYSRVAPIPKNIFP